MTSMMAKATTKMSKMFHLCGQSTVKISWFVANLQRGFFVTSICTQLLTISGVGTQKAVRSSGLYSIRRKRHGHVSMAAAQLPSIDTLKKVPESISPPSKCQIGTKGNTCSTFFLNSCNYTGRRLMQYKKVCMLSHQIEFRRKKTQS